MKRFDKEVKKEESRTPLFYYPYHVELKSDLAKSTIAQYFYGKTTSYALSFQKKDLALLNEENMKKLTGRYVFHYKDSRETISQQIAMVKHVAPIALAHKGVNGFIHFKPGMTVHGVCLEKGKDFEIIVGERVEIEQPVKLSFDDLPDLMGVENE
ncbi:hypothetical protein [Sporosarcina sp. FA9]|uniref:hypothetical protein n=1 Tax=Sporosarcina sp. FA9 TaxID=3413030 RepID=UPI003F658520